MLLAAEQTVQTALIGLAGVSLTGVFGLITVWWTRSNRNISQDTKQSLATTVASVINVETVFDDLRAERNIARLAAERERKRADVAEKRADAAQRKAELLERRVAVLEASDARHFGPGAADS